MFSNKKWGFGKGLLFMLHPRHFFSALTSCVSETIATTVLFVEKHCFTFIIYSLTASPHNCTSTRAAYLPAYLTGPGVTSAIAHTVADRCSVRVQISPEDTAHPAQTVRQTSPRTRSVDRSAVSSTARCTSVWCHLDCHRELEKKIKVSLQYINFQWEGETYQWPHNRTQCPVHSSGTSTSGR